uniref:Uncharacterized protein n=1 Tax=Opuntia streptacantha TaxID=393608 RepID=A0A7C9EJS2_OPUST
MPNSAHRSKASVPNRSTTRAERRRVGSRARSARRDRRAGRDRAKVRAIRVSIFASGGRSSVLTGGRKEESARSEGRAARVATWALDGGAIVGTRKETVKEGKESRVRVASWTNGMRWPIPGVGTITI